MPTWMRKWTIGTGCSMGYPESREAEHARSSASAGVRRAARFRQRHHGAHLFLAQQEVSDGRRQPQRQAQEGRPASLEPAAPQDSEPARLGNAIVREFSGCLPSVLRGEAPGNNRAPHGVGIAFPHEAEGEVARSSLAARQAPRLQPRDAAKRSGRMRARQTPGLARA